MDSAEASDGYLMNSEELLEHLSISASELHVGQLIGTGIVSCVCKANWLHCKVVVKYLPIHNFSSFVSDYSKELEILMRFPHPHVVQLLGYNVSSKRVSIVMERLETTLWDVISDHKKALNGPFAICEALDIMSKISLGMKFLHSRGVTHGGLSTHIILMNVHAQSKFVVKIGGFAFSHHGSQLPTSTKSCSKRSLYDGYRFVLAPEIQAEKVNNDCEFIQRVTKAADVYAFAFICYAMLTGCHPPPWSKNMGSDYRPKLPSDKVDHDIANLIRKCWDANPENRPKFSDICNILTEFRATRDIQVPNETLTVTEDSAALRWTTHKDDEENPGLEIASVLETLPNHLSVDSRDVEWRRLIGEGGYNKVYEVNWLGCTFAMKRFKHLSAELKEMDFLVKLQHPHIARLIGVSFDSNGGWIMMERMDTDLRKLIDSRIQFLREAGRKSIIPFCEDEARELCLKIALGMNFLHSRKVIHRDLKAANVLVHDRCGRFDVKITDFGVSHRIGNPNVVKSAGTGFWRAPEVLKAMSENPLLAEHQLKKTDVFGYAMTCCEIVTGNVPFGGEVVDAFGREFHSRVSKDDVIRGCRPKLPGDLNAHLVKLISDCWNDDPAKRPDFSTICKVLGNNPTWSCHPAAFLDPFLRRKLLLFTDGFQSTAGCLGFSKRNCLALTRHV